MLEGYQSEGHSSQRMWFPKAMMNPPGSPVLATNVTSFTGRGGDQLFAAPWCPPLLQVEALRAPWLSAAHPGRCAESDAWCP